MNTSTDSANFDVMWTSCCQGRRSCPTMKLGDDNTVLIRDDFGNEIRVSTEQFMGIVATGNTMLGEAIATGRIKVP